MQPSLEGLEDPLEKCGWLMDMQGVPLRMREVTTILASRFESVWDVAPAPPPGGGEFYETLCEEGQNLLV